MSEPGRKTKYKYTRELVKIAINEGLSQVEIAKLCRTTQSVVSGWFRGDGKASAQQIQPLVERFGARLNRTTSRVYIVRGPTTTDERWEETPRAKRLLALQDCPWDQLQREPDFNRLSDEIPTPKTSTWGLHALIDADRARFDARTRPEALLRVEGPIVFRYSFCRPVVETWRRIDQLGEEPIARWFVHHQPDSRRLVLVVQQRRLLSEAQARQWQVSVENIIPDGHGKYQSASRLSRAEDVSGRWVRSRDEAACWLSEAHGPMDSAALLAFCDSYFADATTVHGPHDDASCPWLLRKMLVEHGYEVPGIVRLSDGG